MIVIEALILAGQTSRFRMFTWPSRPPSRQVAPTEVIPEVFDVQSHLENSSDWMDIQ